MKKSIYVIMPLAIAGIIIPPNAHASRTFELFGGSVYNMTTPLRIRQTGYDEIKLNARYGAQSFVPPIYYALRFAKWKNNSGWELECIHHKLYLSSKSPEIQYFSVSHGYNLFTLNHARKYKGCIFHSGAGMVIAHPESMIRGKKFSETGGIFHQGYYISGPVIQGAFGKRFSLHEKIFLSFEAKLTGSCARVPIQNGHAVVTNVSIHGLCGLGYDF